MKNNPASKQYVSFLKAKKGAESLSTSATSSGAKKVLTVQAKPEPCSRRSVTSLKAKTSAKMPSERRPKHWSATQWPKLGEPITLNELSEVLDDDQSRMLFAEFIQAKDYGLLAPTGQRRP
ncbi:nucleoid-associated protein YejK [Pseudomonas frederiksbergensis]